MKTTTGEKQSNSHIDLTARVRGGIATHWRGYLFGATLTVLTVTAVGIEFRLSYVEYAIGRYLSWHNHDRQEFGQVWDNVSLSEDVRQRLDNMVRNVQRQEAVQERIGTLGRLLELVTLSDRMVLTRDRFLDMYSELPFYQSSLVIEPMHLQELIGRHPAWERTLIVFEPEGLSFNLLDGLNGVLESIVVPGEYMDFFLREQKTRDYPLDAISELAGGIYPAEAFFEGLVQLTEQDRAGIPILPVKLISWRYRLQRVAVSPGALIGDRMEIGFELVQDDGLRTYRILCHSSSALALLDWMNQAASVQGRETGLDSSAADSLFQDL